jgi:uncharacterized protein
MPPLMRFNESPVGNVISVDTGTVIINISDVEKLRNLQINRLVAITSGKPQQHLIGIIQKITRKIDSNKDNNESSFGDVIAGTIPDISDINLVKIALIGTFYDIKDRIPNVFKRSIHTVPDIDAECYCIEGPKLTAFMEAIATNDKDTDESNKLVLGSYAIDDEAKAYVNGDKFFQRHALIVGSTGSGKSWTVAKIIEQVSSLPTGSSIVFDIHGEYSKISKEGVAQFKIASPQDAQNKKGLSDGVIYTPYWLLRYEDMIDMLVDASDNNAHNQASAVSYLVRKAKEFYLKEKEIDIDFTVDSPIPYYIDGNADEINIDKAGAIEGDINGLLAGLKKLNVARDTTSSATGKVAAYNGKFDRLIPRLENKTTDKRLGFMFSCPEETFSYEYLSSLCKELMYSKDKGKVKVIDFSEVPSDILPLITGMVARIVFEIQQWTLKEHRHPISIFCDEAHLYMPNNHPSGIEGSSLRLFERIAKEGRKYGVSLVVVSQRPSEVNKTILSQCSNFIAMRLTNPDDQNIIKRLFPDNLEGFADTLPTLDIGEALVLGDSVLLPTRIKIDEPSDEAKPESQTIDFWKVWSANVEKDIFDKSVESWRKQSVK